MPAVSNPFAIVVFEKQPYWGPELQRQFQHSDVLVRECRSIRDLLAGAGALDKTLFVIDLEADLEQTLEWFGTGLAICHVSIPIIALGSKAHGELEWVLREAGVSAFLPEFVTGEHLARLCRRMLVPAGFR